GAGEDRRHRQGSAAGLHATAPHVVAEGGDGQLLGDLRVLDVCPAAAPADEVALAREVVERGAHGEPRDAEIGAQLALGGDRRPDAELLNEVEDLPARMALLGHLRHAHGPAHYRPVPQNWSMPLRLPPGTGIDLNLVAGIVLERVSKVFGGGVVAVDDVSLEIQSGEFRVP